MKVACSWSGGKDSCLACWKALAEGLDVCYLVNFVSVQFGRESLHGVKRELMRLQSEATTIPMVQRRTTWEGYEDAFREVMTELRELGIDGLVTGDMDVIEHRTWVENKCSEFGLKPVLPLWGFAPDEVLGEFIDEGFEAVVVCLKAELMDGSWLGRRIDREFMSDLKSSQDPGFNICGENGEYHSFVIDGPLFQKRISFAYGDKVWRDGYGFLDIERAELVLKGE